MYKLQYVLPLLMLGELFKETILSEWESVYIIDKTIFCFVLVYHMAPIQLQEKAWLCFYTHAAKRM